MQPWRGRKYYALPQAIVRGRLLHLQTGTPTQDIRKVAWMRGGQVLQDQNCGVEIRLERAYHRAQGCQAAGRWSNADDRQRERTVVDFSLRCAVTAPPRLRLGHPSRRARQPVPARQWSLGRP